jgi:hypothetical protein
MFEKLLEHREHIPPHRVWAFLNTKGELSLPENTHLLHCEDCSKIFAACIRAESFGEALQIWVDEKSA